MAISRVCSGVEFGCAWCSLKHDKKLAGHPGIPKANFVSCNQLLELRPAHFKLILRRLVHFAATAPRTARPGWSRRVEPESVSVVRTDETSVQPREAQIPGSRCLPCVCWWRRIRLAHAPDAFHFEIHPDHAQNDERHGEGQHNPRPAIAEARPGWQRRLGHCGNHFRPTFQRNLNSWRRWAAALS